MNFCLYCPCLLSDLGEICCKRCVRNAVKELWGSCNLLQECHTWKCAHFVSYNLSLSASPSPGSDWSLILSMISVFPPRFCMCCCSHNLVHLWHEYNMVSTQKTAIVFQKGNEEKERDITYLIFLRDCHIHFWSGSYTNIIQCSAISVCACDIASFNVFVVHKAHMYWLGISLIPKTNVSFILWTCSIS